MTDGEPWRLELAPALGPLAAPWRELAEASGNVFLSYEWLSAWWRHFGRGRRLLIGVVTTPQPESRVAAILPLYEAASRPVQVLRQLGHGTSDELGPVCRPEDRLRAAQSLRRLSEQLGRRRHLLIADELPAGIEWAPLLGGRTVLRQASPVCRFQGTEGYERWLAGRSPNLRSQLARGRRRLSRMGEVRFRRTARSDELEADFATLVRLHEARWRADGGSRAFRHRLGFHLDFARRAFERGWLRLRFLEVDGRAVAALYNLRFGAAESFYQAGRDPAYASCSVGMLLHVQAMAEAAAEGVTEYRLLRGDEPYKARLATSVPEVESVARAHGVLGRAAMVPVAGAPAWPRRLRRLVPSSLAVGAGGTPLWGPP